MTKTQVGEQMNGDWIMDKWVGEWMADGRQMVGRRVNGWVSNKHTDTRLMDEQTSAWRDR